MSIALHPGGGQFDLAGYMNRILAGPLPASAQSSALSDLTERIASAPKSPLDLAAESLKAMVPGHDFAWYRQEAMWIVRTNREDRTPVERVVIRRYQDAVRAQRGGE